MISPPLAAYVRRSESSNPDRRAERPFCMGIASHGFPPGSRPRYQARHGCSAPGASPGSGRALLASLREAGVERREVVLWDNLGRLGLIRMWFHGNMERPEGAYDQGMERDGFARDAKGIPRVSCTVPRRPDLGYDRSGRAVIPSRRLALPVSIYSVRASRSRPRYRSAASAARAPSPQEMITRLP